MSLPTSRHWSMFPWGALIAAIPLAHILASAVYLYLYAVGFGGGLIRLLSPTDVLAVSIEKLGTFYAVILVGAVILSLPALWTEVRRRRQLQNKFIERSKVSELRDWLRFSKKLRKFGWALLCLGSLVAVLATFSFLDSWMNRQPMLFGFQSDFVWLIGVGTLIVSLPRPNARVAVAVSLLVTANIVFGHALMDGQIDRLAPLSEAKGYPRIGRSIVIRALGNNFLAVLPSGQRVVLDGEGRVVLTFAVPQKEHRWIWEQSGGRAGP